VAAAGENRRTFVVTVRLHNSLDGAGAFDRILADGSRRFIVMVSISISAAAVLLLMVWISDLDLDLIEKIENYIYFLDNSTIQYCRPS
jgi:hypothetical protein